MVHDRASNCRKSRRDVANEERSAGYISDLLPIFEEYFLFEIVEFYYVYE